MGTAVEKEKFLFAALAAAKLGYTAYKMFSLPQVANFKKAEHYMALSQTATSVQEKEKFLFAALAAAKLGYTAYKMLSLTWACPRPPRELSRVALESSSRRAPPSSARPSRQPSTSSRTAKPSGRELDPSASNPSDARPR